MRDSVKVVIPDSTDEAFCLDRRQNVKTGTDCALFRLHRRTCDITHLHVLFHLLLLVSQLAEGIDDQT